MSSANRFSDIKSSVLNIKSYDILPIIKGTTIRNENFAAFSLSIPKSTDVDIVAPDLEIPGNIAIACAIPIIKLFLIFKDFYYFFALSASRSRIPVIINIKPIKTKL